MSYIKSAFERPSYMLTMRFADPLLICVASLIFVNVLIYGFDYIFSMSFLYLLLCPTIIFVLIVSLQTYKFFKRKKVIVNDLGCFGEEDLFNSFTVQKAVAIHLQEKDGLKQLSLLPFKSRSTFFSYQAIDAVIKTHEYLIKNNRTDVRFIFGDSVSAKSFVRFLKTDGIKSYQIKSPAFVFASLAFYSVYDIKYFKRFPQLIKYFKWPTHVEISREWLNYDQNMRQLKMLREMYKRRLT
ncbi:hypothetical protein EBB07_28480 [Paenibacillaceae bacterium]|nr:hypothetical protein EBB07_28480 [Paenibacillaceae bacterium]